MKRHINRTKFGLILIPLLMLINAIPVKGQDKTIQSIFDVFKQRRSVRQYQATPVPKEHLEKILQAAAWAPNAGNQQPWKFLVIETEETKQKLKEACIQRSMERIKNKTDWTQEQKDERISSTKEYYEGCFTAPVFVVVLTDNESTYPTYNHWDGPLAAGYLMLAARALGYGTVFYTDSIPDEVTKKVLNIPDRYTRVCITPIGVPAEWPDAPPKKELDELVSYETIN